MANNNPVASCMTKTSMANEPKKYHKLKFFGAGYSVSCVRQSDEMGSLWSNQPNTRLALDWSMLFMEYEILHGVNATWVMHCYVQRFGLDLMASVFGLATLCGAATADDFFACWCRSTARTYS